MWILEGGSTHDRIHDANQSSTLSIGETEYSGDLDLY
tara:strand:- start:1164 stop:1274 length:111 start_codon:yes stop_codon:yes gene_type:complete